MSGWEGSNRRLRLPADWEQRRQLVLARDGRKCQWRDGDRTCGWKATDVDHIIPNDDDSLENLRSLCSWHHRRKSASEGGTSMWQRRTAIKQRFAREPERHPGRIA